MTAKPKKELMARLRKERKEAGLVLFSAWVTPEMRDKLKKLCSKNGVPTRPE